LPGDHGIGEIGPAARVFVDMLADAGQSWWQVLPLNPTDPGGCPYSATSSFASSPMLIDLDDLVLRDLLKKEELAPLATLPKDRVAFHRVLPAKALVLELAMRRFLDNPRHVDRPAFDEYCASNDPLWLSDFALFSALNKRHDEAHWREWPHALKHRDEDAMRTACRDLADDIDVVRAQQFFFDLQWRDLRAYALKRGVKLIGDMPIFVSDNSADVWALPHLFKLDAELNNLVVAGVPPDYFSATGQLWGNPVYDWQAMQNEDFAWWKARVRQLLTLVDVVRIDHFRGFAASWETPAGETTAINGQWVAAPGMQLFEALSIAHPDMPFIAEDLGHITEDVIALRDRFALPGLRILQFAFGEGPALGDRHPSHYPEASVCYPATHDNNTMLGWLRNDGLEAASRAKDAAREARNALETVNSDESGFAAGMVDLAMRSGSSLALVQLQDVMGLDGRARMNTPGTVNRQNWAWRYCEGELTPEMIDALSRSTKRAGRAPS
jgi:4-alpha-glucanotransferase